MSEREVVGQSKLHGQAMLQHYLFALPASGC